MVTRLARYPYADYESLTNRVRDLEAVVQAMADFIEDRTGYRMEWYDKRVLPRRMGGNGPEPEGKGGPCHALGPSRV